ncbi:hypothetical protein ACFULT_21105 [Rhodococcus sp. NPDC057297]|uniref:hypothetical protein n=1 Tax=Rhodococcus sp. NPDC057297 TaxID=3346090 RepID=UPI00363EBC4C
MSVPGDNAAARNIGDEELSSSRLAPASVCPRWYFATTINAERYAVIADLEHNYSGWSVEIAHEGNVHLGQLSQKALWRSEEPDFNLIGLGDPVTGWAVPIDGGAIVEAFITPTGTRIELDKWVYTIEWLVESLTDQPVALIIDLGPNDYVQNEDDPGDVPCAQLQVMADDVYMVRRSRTELGHLMLTDYSTAGVTLDKWYLQEHFHDCTDGYMFTRDRRLAAEICATWFRDNQEANMTSELGCNYRYADELLSEDPKLF